MNGYELHVQGKGDIWRIADFGSDLPAFNFQANDISELEHRQANYSQKLKLPITQTNRLIFGDIDAPDAEPVMPYRRIPCRLYSNGFQLAGKGAFLVVLMVTDFFEVQILSGTANIFEQLKAAQMSDLDLGYLTLLDPALLPENFTEYYLYALSTIEIGGPKSTTLLMGAGNYIPFVWYWRAIKKMIQNLGYAITSNIEPDLEKIITPVVNFGTEPQNLRRFHTSIGNTQTVDYKGTMDIPLYKNGGESTEFLTPTEVRFTAPFNCTVTVKCYIAAFVEGNMFITTGVIVQKNEISTIAYAEVTIPLGFYGLKNDEKTVQVDLKMGDTLDIRAYFIDNNYSDDILGAEEIAFNINITNIIPANNTPIAGQTINLAASLGFATQFDFLKAFVQATGLTFEIDEKTKTLYANTLNELYINRDMAKNWSDKILVNRNIEKSYVLDGYAQNNTIAFQDNTKDNVTDSASFSVSNETLAPTKILFTLPFEAGFDSIVNNFPFTIANIPIRELSDVGEIKISSTKPHIMTVGPVVNFEMIEGNKRDYYAAQHLKADTMLSVYYDVLINRLLNKAVIISEEILLTSSDIDNFSFFTPVYVARYGKYFYVNKIVNFIEDKTTKVELVKL